MRTAQADAACLELRPRDLTVVQCDKADGVAEGWQVPPSSRPIDMYRATVTAVWPRGASMAPATVIGARRWLAQYCSAAVFGAHLGSGVRRVWNNEWLESQENADKTCDMVLHAVLVVAVPADQVVAPAHGGVELVRATA